MNLRSVAASVSIGAALSCGAGCAQQREPDYIYTTTVTIADGKTVECAVNEPLAGPAASDAPLSTAEKRQAEVLAMHRLFLETGPWSDYPTPYTAPDIKCRAIRQ
ncbi:hypothetical protein GWC77_02950 [Paraburkholderia sp. NMBU_R16]|uniref:hypothetical protein n=1 Tax=Paraburkholderia sp. NMBU_R16 TaxID=2698676 RepID=UPI001565FD64|nr:hypothetical protein [Paraburkholderia sp. NMBU_R16]NRO94902.1 hypothetical protein [Paraburkholderia sp. NMBU_R16]